MDLKLTALPVIEAQNVSAGKGKDYATSTKGRIRASYVALSYVWGQGEKAYTTTRNNVMLRRRHGGLENSIADFPRALQDSIELVKGMSPCAMITAI